MSIYAKVQNQIHAALLITRKKGEKSRVFPSGLVIPNPTLEYYVAKSNTNLPKDATHDLAPDAGVPRIHPIVDVDVEPDAGEERLSRMEKQVDDLLKRVAELEKQLPKKQKK